MSSRKVSGVAEAQLNILLARLLRVGLLIAMAILLAGVVATAVRGGGSVPRHASLAEMPGLLRRLQPGGFFTLGLLILLLTPAARVVALVIAFSRDRQWLFVGFSALVLVLLILCGVLGMTA